MVDRWWRYGDWFVDGIWVVWVSYILSLFCANDESVRTNVRKDDLWLAGYPDEWGVLKDRKSTRLNSSHVSISYAVFCLKKKTSQTRRRETPWLRTPAHTRTSDT